MRVRRLIGVTSSRARAQRHRRCIQPGAPPNMLHGFHCLQVNVVFKFGGSSVRDAERMREVADIVCGFPEFLPCVVLSAMGKVSYQEAIY